MPERSQFLADLSAVVRSMHDQRGGQLTIERAVAAVTEIIDACDLAGVSFANRGGVRVRAATDEAVAHVETLQHIFGEGPIVDALRDRETVHSTDLAADARWPTWGPAAAAQEGLRSVVSYRLFTTHTTLGSFNMFSRTVDAFSDDDIAEGLALGAHIAVAVAAELDGEHLQHALTNRTVIGQAEGILMERFDLDADRAFEVLSRLSSHRNVKLHRIAADLVATRHLPRDARPMGSDAGRLPPGAGRA